MLGHILKNDLNRPLSESVRVRNIDMIVGLLAILKAGKAYLPFDPDNPPTRLQPDYERDGYPNLLKYIKEFPFF